MSEVTELLIRSERGDDLARDRLYALLYDDLKRLASRAVGPGPARTLNTTGLVHECYMRLAAAEATPVSRGHFFALSARIMRQIVCDHARRRLAEKRGGDVQVGTLDEQAADALSDEATRMIELDDLLNALAEQHPRQAQVVGCRVFAGLTVPETAEALGVSERTVELDWANAREWLAGASRPAK
jgi:RNA polymerase sigma factor (TIGR02999 family)